VEQEAVRVVATAVASTAIARLRSRQCQLEDPTAPRPRR
jgi:hypothetical protein